MAKIDKKLTDTEIRSTRPVIKKSTYSMVIHQDVAASKDKRQA